MKNNREEIVIGLDVGTTKVAALVGVKTEDAPIEVIGVGEAPSKGLKKGVVVDLENTTEAIIRAVEAAEEMAGVEINSVYVTVSGSHIAGRNSQGSVPITNENFEITEEDVEQTLASAKAVQLPIDRMVLHVLPQDFSIEGQKGIRDPRGMSGAKLEAGVHIVTAGITMVRNLEKCLNRAELDLEGLILGGFASAHSTLTQEEKDMGVVLIDMGGGTSDCVVFTEGAVKFSYCLPGGGAQITNDIALGLRLPPNKAEELKIRHGGALRSEIPASEEFMMPGVLGRPSKNMSSRDLASIIEARVEENFYLLKKQIEISGIKEKIGSGVVLCGGSAQLKDIDKLAQRVFNIPVRTAHPRGIEGLDHLLEYPSYATGVGLLTLGGELRNEKVQESPKKVRVYDIISGMVKKFITKD